MSLHCGTGHKYRLKAESQNDRIKLDAISGKINPLFHSLKYYTCGYFAQCSYFFSGLEKKNFKTLKAAALVDGCKDEKKSDSNVDTA